MTNIGKYNEGYLVGEWVLPVYGNDFRGGLDRIGINEEYEEYFITDFDNSPIKIDEFDCIDSLNILAEFWEELSDTERVLLEYLLNYESLSISEAIGRDFTCSRWTLYDGLAICREEGLLPLYSHTLGGHNFEDSLDTGQV